MIILSEQLFLTIGAPSSIKYYNGLSKSEQNNFLLLYSLYNYFLNLYILKKYNLKKYDNKLKNSSLFKHVSVGQKDIYQYRAQNFLEFYYLRNNIFIERLTEQEKEYLNSRINSQNLDFDDVTEKFINNTFMRVVLENANTNHMTIFGPNNSKFIKPSNSIIIGLRYDEDFVEQDKSFEQTYYEREKILYFINNALKTEFERKINLPFDVIVYNDNSINEKIGKI